MFEIRVVSRNGEPVPEGASAIFGPEGGTIGRAPGNTMVLADPDRYVSRMQAKLRVEAGRAFISNASAANPLLVNDRELAPHEEVELGDGDQLRMGLYVLAVSAITTELRRHPAESQPDATRVAAAPLPAGTAVPERDSTAGAQPHWRSAPAPAHLPPEAPAQPGASMPPPAPAAGPAAARSGAASPNGAAAAQGKATSASTLGDLGLPLDPLAALGALPAGGPPAPAATPPPPPAARRDALPPLPPRAAAPSGRAAPRAPLDAAATAPPKEPALSPRPAVAPSAPGPAPAPSAPSLGIPVPKGVSDPFADLLGPGCAPLSESAAAASSGIPPSAGTAARPAGAALSTNPFADVLQPALPGGAIGELDSVLPRAPAAGLGTPGGPDASDPWRRPLIPEDFDPFALPSQSARNAADPLAALRADNVTLDSIANPPRPVDDFISGLDEKKPIGEPLPDRNPVAVDPLGVPTDDPLALFGVDDPMLRAPRRDAIGRSVADNVREIDSFFRAPEARPDPLLAPRAEDVPPAVSAAGPLGAERGSCRGPEAFVAGGAESPLPPQSPGLIPEEFDLGIPGIAAAPPPRSAAPAPQAPEAAVAVPSVPLVQSVSPHSAPGEQTAVAPARSEREAGDAGRPSVLASGAPGSRAADRPSADTAALLAALLAGARVPDAPVPAGLTPELLETVGRMLNVAVQGTLDLIAARGALKREVKAEVTMIAPKRNNPLKFLPDAEAALLQMFGQRIPGFMGPVDAMEDAYRDLRAHEVGLVAGMRAALAEVLRRFDPEALEERIKQKSRLIDSLLPGARKARLWDLFAEMYEEISREAQDDFQSLFGKAFLAAYQEEIERVRRTSGS